MSSSHFNFATRLVGRSIFSLYCAMLSLLGLTGYYADILRYHLPDWAVVGLLVTPITIILFIQWGDVPDRIVAISHIIAASLFMILAIGMEIGILIGYHPKGTNFYRVLAHIGWTFAWGDIYRRARLNSKKSVEQNGATSS